MDTFVVDGLTARVHRAGAAGGVPLLYLHSGFGEVGALPLFDALAGAGFAVTAPELPGFGRSDPDPAAHRVEDVLFHLRRVVDTLGLDRPLVVGSSLGGWLAAELAVWFPERVGPLVLVDAVGLRLDGAPVFDLFHARQGDTLRRALPHGPALLELLAPTLALVDGDDPNAVLLHFFHALEALAKVGWNPFLHDPKLLARLPLVTSPTLVVWGADDGIVPVAHGEAYAGAIPGAHLEVLDRCGHLPALEQPDALAKLVAGHR
jgi:pimeloyl-ACP methyl ester carboxylesterase